MTSDSVLIFSVLFVSLTVANHSNTAGQLCYKY